MNCPMESTGKETPQLPHGKHGEGDTQGSERLAWGEEGSDDSEYNQLLLFLLLSTPETPICQAHRDAVLPL